MSLPAVDPRFWRWHWELPVAIALGAVALAYVAWWTVRRRAGSRTARPPVAALIAFLAGLAIVVLALMSPIGANDEVLLSMHMVEHDLLIWITAPLMLFGVIPLFEGGPAPSPAVRRIVDGLTHPVVAIAVSTSLLWGWHVPAAYEWALRNEEVHLLEHASFLGGSLLYWWPLVAPPSLTRWLPRNPSRALYLLAGTTQSATLASLIAFHHSVLYPTYLAAPRLTTLSAIADQRLAGMLMVFPGALIFTVAVIYLLRKE
jgi:putative membrane protein